MSELKVPVNSIKAVLVGSVGSGKSAIWQGLMGRGFPVSHAPTIGVDFGSTTIKVQDEKIQFEGKIQYWDTASQEKFAGLLPGYLRNTKSILLVVDYDKLTNEALRDQHWKEITEYWETVKENTPEATPVHFIVNKMDLQKEKCKGKTQEEINAENTGISNKIKSLEGYADETIIFYSAKDAADKDLTKNPIVQAILSGLKIQPMPSLPSEPPKYHSHPKPYERVWTGKGFLAWWGHGGHSNPSIEPYPYRDKILATIIHFLRFAFFLVSLMAIGAGIGYAAGVWASAPQFFAIFSALFLGAMNPAMLALVVIVPVISLLATIAVGLYQDRKARRLGWSDVPEKTVDDGNVVLKRGVTEKENDTQQKNSFGQILTDDVTASPQSPQNEQKGTTPTHGQ